MNAVRGPLAVVVAVALCLLAPHLARSAGPSDPQQPLLPHDALALLDAQVAELFKQQALKGPQAASLLKVLDKTRRSLFRGLPDAALGHLNDFTDKVQSLVNRGALDKVTGETLLTGAGAVQGGIASLLKVPFPAWPDIGFCTGPPVPPLPKIPTLYVQEGAPAGGDGSSVHPFRSIGAALTAAAGGALGAVQVMVGFGVYSEHLEITRYTRLVGLPLVSASDTILPVIVGSVTNFSPVGLEIDHIALTGFGTTHVGVLTVENKCAATALNDVLVTDGVGFGIFQHGGWFDGHDLRVERTHPVSSVFGVAFQLEGVETTLANTALTANLGGGLLVSGGRMTASGLDVAETEPNPYALARATFSTNPGTTAVDVRDDAAFTGTWVRLTGNTYVGMFVHTGAAADLTYSRVEDTAEIHRYDSMGFDAVNVGGHDIVVSGPGTLRATGFTILSARVCGALFTGDGAEATFMHGEIAYNEFGACYPAAFDTHDLFGAIDVVGDDGVLTEIATVDYHDNREGNFSVTLDSAAPPVPPPPVILVP